MATPEKGADLFFDRQINPALFACGRVISGHLRANQE
jgi:hypothetical protein